MAFKVVSLAEFDDFVGNHVPILHSEYQQIGDPPSTRFYNPDTKELVAVIVHCYGPSGDAPEYRIRD